MQFLVLGWDIEDSGPRRDRARPAHTQRMEQLRKEGSVLVGAALLGDDDQIIGSFLITDFPSRADLDAWMESEPLVTEGVWGEVVVRRCRVGDTYMEKLRR